MESAIYFTIQQECCRSGRRTLNTFIVAASDHVMQSERRIEGTKPADMEQVLALLSVNGFYWLQACLVHI